MTNKNLFFLLSCVVGSIGMSRLCAQDARPDAKALLQSAHQVSGLEQAQPYELRAIVVVHPGSPEEVKGQITIYRDKDRSRAELRVARYSETRLVLGNKLYISRSTSFPAPGLGAFTAADRVWDRLAEDGGAILGDVSNKKVRNTPAACFEVKGDQRHRLCFDASRKVLLENLDQQRAVVFSDYQTLDNQLVPRKFMVMAELEQSEKPIFAVQDIQVQKAQVLPTMFAVPDHSLEFETCENMQETRVLESPRPEFSRMVRGRNAGALGVYAYGIVDKEGNLQNVKVLSSDPDVQQTVQEALKKWRYIPAQCGTTPVAAEQEIQIPFGGGEGSEGGRSRR